ncbi:protein MICRORCHIDIA 7-like isoform X2 [Phoenix dactylifera]|uniref:Protein MICRORCHIDIA 7-like isoform X2 n=1 Tax=Phoenix dactylifera TaxID=42345 RepID=A0A8B8ZJP0_PHODC|nr:protein MICRORCHIDIA 7-like isoform X2 [Phoenix dactylifera]
MDSIVKAEIVNAGDPPASASLPAPEPPRRPSEPPAVIDLSSSDSDSEAEEGGGGGAKRSAVPNGSDDGGPFKKLRAEGGLSAALPLGFLDPLPPDIPPLLPRPVPLAVARPLPPATGFQGCKQFWKAGDYEESPIADSTPYYASGMDRVRVHPKFLHSNATSHKWALGALAELLDNSLDEVCNGATYVNIDMLENKKDGTRMLLVEDNGGGMDPDKMRQCMSLGYSAKSKVASTIGQYGNGFKTSTMRLGADVIVFSCSRAKGGRRPTQSIGMLSYTFLRSTAKEDIVVPMLYYEKGQTWNKMVQSSLADWSTNLETILQWSPYSSEADLLQQFSSMKDQGTRIIIYNLWEDDQGQLELDFDVDKYDIQVGGVNRDEKKIQMAKQFPNSRHFLTYRHSLRSYASILYLRLPHFFRMILRGKEIEHHNLVNDMMLKQEVTYKPHPGADGVPKDPNMVAVVTIGFVKDAKNHIDVQGFNVYHKNRLIKPFWRVWSAAGSDGRGVIGVLEANFVEPAHDKQDFERTTILSRLETRLVQMQKTYWSTNCHRIGYAPRRTKKQTDCEDRESSPEAPSHSISQHSKKYASPNGVSHRSKPQNSIKIQSTGKSFSGSNVKAGNARNSPTGSGKLGIARSLFLRERNVKSAEKVEKDIRSPLSKANGTRHISDDSDLEIECVPSKKTVNDSGGPKCSTNNLTKGNHAANEDGGINQITTRSHSKASTVLCNGSGQDLEESELSIKQLKDENKELNNRLKRMEESMLQELQYERDRNKSLNEQLEAAHQKLEAANKEQEALIEIFSEERGRRDKEEENLRKKLKDASLTIQELIEKLGTSRK